MKNKHNELKPTATKSPKAENLNHRMIANQLKRMKI